MNMVAILNKHNLHYQKVVILPVLVTTHLPYTFILPCFSLANLVQPTRLSSTALLLAEFANDHRFLVNEKFKVMMAFMEQLAVNYQKGYYDLRNEWACTLAHAAIEALREQQLYYPSSPEYSPNK